MAALIRDVVEVVAIIAAGAWAIYTFVYEEKIKPGSDQPAVLLTGSLHRLAERGGLVQMEYQATLHNPGRVRVNVIAYAFTINGVKYTARGTPGSAVPYEGTTLFFRDGRPLPVQPVYRQITLTRFVKPKYGGGFELEPGEEEDFSGIFLVRKADFDSLTLDGSTAVTKYDGLFPTKITFTPSKAVYFQSANDDQRYSTMQETLDRATLW